MGLEGFFTLATVSSDLAVSAFSSVFAAGESVARGLAEGSEVSGSSGDPVEVAVRLSGEAAGATCCRTSVLLEVDGCEIAGALAGCSKYLTAIAPSPPHKVAPKRIGKITSSFRR